jgi:hypothetical protein
VTHDAMLAALLARGWEFGRHPDGREDFIQPIPPEPRRAEYAALWDAFRADRARAKAAIRRHLDGRLRHAMGASNPALGG